jgi:hypothetical protein
MLLHTDSFYDMGFHTQTAFTHRSFCTHKLLHAGAFARKCFSTQKTVYTDFSKQRYLYTELLLHTENSYIYRHAFLHRSLYAWMPSHTNASTCKAFKHRGFGTQGPLQFLFGMPSELRNSKDTTRWWGPSMRSTAWTLNSMVTELKS